MEVEGRNSEAPGENLNSRAEALRAVRAREVGRGLDQGECAGVPKPDPEPRTEGLAGRKGEVGALRDDALEEGYVLLAVADKEGVGEGRTEDIVIPDWMWRREEEDRDTVGREGVRDPFEGRGGTGVEEGWRSSR